MTADLELQSLGETDALLKTSERPKKRALAIQIIALCGAAALAGAALASRAGPQSFFGHHDDDINRTMKRSLYFRSLKRLARFLLSEFLPKPRRSISTQTDAD